MGILPHVLTGALYAILAVYLWNTRWRSPQARASALAASERIAILVPWAAHSWLLWTVIFAPGEFRFGFGDALSAMLWLAVAIYWVENLFVNVEGMQPLVLGLAAICTPLPALFPGFPSPGANSTEFRVHLTLAILAYGLFTLAALHALLMTVVERRLHHRTSVVHPRTGAAPHRGDAAGTGGPGAQLGPLSGPLTNLPPLLTLEALLFRLIGLGFLLLSLTLATGIAFSETLFGKPLRFDHKTVFAILSWIIFAVLLTGRHRYGWRGRTALRYTLAGFFSLLLAYVGSRFVLEVILHRPEVM